MFINERKRNANTYLMDGQHNRKHRLWFGKIKRDSKKEKQMAQAGGGKD